MDEKDFTDELARTENFDKFCENIVQSIKVGKALAEKTNQEIGRLLIEHVQNDMEIFSPQYELIEATLARLGFDFEQYYEEEDGKEAKQPGN